MKSKQSNSIDTQKQTKIPVDCTSPRHLYILPNSRHKLLKLTHIRHFTEIGQDIQT